MIKNQKHEVNTRDAFNFGGSPLPEMNVNLYRYQCIALFEFEKHISTGV